MSAPEILIIDKTVGMTSFDVIRVLRKHFTIKKMGHAGTLDPLASGVLVVGIGAGTKKLNNYLKLPKTYGALVRFGERRSTGDLEGEVLEEKDAGALTREDVEKALRAMRGELLLPVPAFSAIKVDGKPLYKNARRGIEMALPQKKMCITEATLNSFIEGERAEAEIEFVVTSGTYVRSLAEELGRRVGYPATLAGLRRTSVGEFTIKEAKPIDLFT
ncbi:tRNA pseudouridine(55) synthase TruB [Candidatus Kaiserbacteria bacterium CG10_big_fil_rev_8_21_14_0_10_49_17]|uniref:tRNA pseudouridine synthase B n=1 Tax=Candidatus Kaiserbacteria bacterium CG10_big_fil_rev_8_21_14_0_10_49_17 TaxID=1974609 RepID=A0A2M6WED1_9BACT|nr:MAG: tRNA pseudouridine(55) synthase TruB [Candidatus Kaiserbacteria bacterium CG10_big_fil_rev_8_21_14_0_10_49_17]